MSFELRDYSTDERTGGRTGGHLCHSKELWGRTYDGIDDHEVTEHQKFSPRGLQDGEYHLNPLEVARELDNRDQSEKPHLNHEKELDMQVNSRSFGQ